MGEDDNDGTCEGRGERPPDHAARVRRSQETDTLIAALKTLQSTDFDAMRGRGIMVRLTPITATHRIADEFTIAAEDFKEIAPLMAASLRRSLMYRRELRAAEIRRIDRMIGLPSTEITDDHAG